MAVMNCNLYMVEMHLDTNHSITSATCRSQTPSVSVQRLSIASLSFGSDRYIQLEKPLSAGILRLCSVNKLGLMPIKLLVLEMIVTLRNAVLGFISLNVRCVGCPQAHLTEFSGFLFCELKTVLLYYLDS